MTADERYFRVRLDVCGDEAIDTSGHTELERRVMRSWRWFDAAALAMLDEPLYPEDLATLLGWAPAIEDAPITV